MKKRTAALLFVLASAGCGCEPEPSKKPSLFPTDALVVWVDQDGGFSIGGEALTKEHLAARLKKEGDRAGREGESQLSKLEVVIRADERAKFKFVQQVLLECMKANIWKTTFVAGDGTPIFGHRHRRTPESRGAP